MTNESKYLTMEFDSEIPSFWFFFWMAKSATAKKSPPSMMFVFAEEQLRRALPTLLESNHHLRLLDDLKKSTGKPEEFLYDLSKPWGFGGVLKPAEGNDDGLLGFVLEIPKVETVIGTCPSCDGVIHDEECRDCYGSGEETEHDSRALEQICATLSLLSFYFDLPKSEWLGDKNHSENMKQIMLGKNQMLSMAVRYGKDGDCGLGAVLSKEFADLLEKKQQQEIPTAAAAAREALLYMTPNFAKYAGNGFQARIGEGGQLFIRIPGSMLYVNGFKMREQSGAVRLQTDAVNSHVHQLALIAGLSEVCGWAKILDGD